MLRRHYIKISGFTWKIRASDHSGLTFLHSNWGRRLAKMAAVTPLSASASFKYDFEAPPIKKWVYFSTPWVWYSMPTPSRDLQRPCPPSPPTFFPCVCLSPLRTLWPPCEQVWASPQDNERLCGQSWVSSCVPDTWESPAKVSKADLQLIADMWGCSARTRRIIYWARLNCSHAEVWAK